MAPRDKLADGLEPWWYWHAWAAVVVLASAASAVWPWGFA